MQCVNIFCGGVALAMSTLNDDATQVLVLAFVDNHCVHHPSTYCLDGHFMLSVRYMYTVHVSHCNGIFKLIFPHIYKIEITRKCGEKKNELRLHFISIAPSFITCICMMCGCNVSWEFLPRFPNDIDNNTQTLESAYVEIGCLFRISHLSIVWN